MDIMLSMDIILSASVGVMVIIGIIVFLFLLLVSDGAELSPAKQRQKEYLETGVPPIKEIQKRSYSNEELLTQNLLGTKRGMYTAERITQPAKVQPTAPIHSNTMTRATPPHLRYDALSRRIKRSQQRFSDLSLAHMKIQEPITLLERPLLLDNDVSQVITMIREFMLMVTLDEELSHRFDTAIANDQQERKQLELIELYDEQLDIAEQAFNTADSHARSIGIPNTTEMIRRQGRKLINIILDDRKGSINERENAWDKLVTLVTAVGIKPEQISVVQPQVREIISGIRLKELEYNRMVAPDMRLNLNQREKA